MISYKSRRESRKKPSESKLVAQHRRELRLARPHREQVRVVLLAIEPATADEIARAIGSDTWACDEHQVPRFALLEVVRQMTAAGEIRRVKISKDRRKFFATGPKTY